MGRVGCCPTRVWESPHFVAFSYSTVDTPFYGQRVAGLSFYLMAQLLSLRFSTPCNDSALKKKLFFLLFNRRSTGSEETSNLLDTRQHGHLVSTQPSARPPSPGKGFGIAAAGIVNRQDTIAPGRPTLYGAPAEWRRKTANLPLQPPIIAELTMQWTYAALSTVPDAYRNNTRR